VDCALAIAAVNFIYRPRDMPLARELIAEETKLRIVVITKVVACHRYHIDVAWCA
jgi:hypothetical protein